ncbi:hypothetical protein QAD02_012699 [Eretmocerus hayati]|uniref:Uncharacterized protein n=1 Tax=Eretmocerus hayati TaxID=131215 RepID=A0ACC2P0L8_9HYME|nr:hypothetical protein QAD02_012699 [Eretmocerus hayati]
MSKRILLEMRRDLDRNVIFIFPEDQEVNRSPVEGVKIEVGRKAKKVRVVKGGSDRGEEEGFDVRLFQAALRMSLEKEKDKADDPERLRATQENSTGPQFVNHDEIAQDDSNDMNPAPDTEQDIVAHASGVRVEHPSHQVTRTYSRHTPESGNLYLTVDLSKEKYSYLVKDL